MSKIICDVCGTTYQDSAQQCPICGCVRPSSAEVDVLANDQQFQRSEKYTYVKGGRFSKANVQKRNQMLLHEDAKVEEKAEKQPDAKAGKSDKGLVIAVCALLLAIIAVAIYIAVQFFAPNNADTGALQDTTAESPSTVVTTQPITEPNIPCTEIVLSQTEVTLNALNESVKLEATITPADTTDSVFYTSSDEAIVSVSEEGEILAVAAGEAVVTVTCGEVSAECRVICNAQPETTDAVEIVGDFKAPYKINKTDVTIPVGTSFELKLTDANRNIIPVQWSATIEDSCGIEGNVITGLIKGKTEVSATYNGETFSCIIRVK